MGKVEKVSDRLNRISVSQTLEMAKRSRELRDKGADIIDLSIGQPDFKLRLILKRPQKGPLIMI
jgi:aspartate aminotransferase